MDNQQGQNNMPAPSQSTPNTVATLATDSSSTPLTAPTPPVSSPVPPTTGLPPTPNQPSSQPAKKSSIMPIIIIVIIIALVLAGAGAYFWMHKQTPQQMMAAPQPTMQPKPTTSAQVIPTISPVTSTNVDQTLNNADTKMQQAVSQANSDLNSVNNINTSQDSTSGL